MIKYDFKFSVERFTVYLEETPKCHSIIEFEVLFEIKIALNVVLIT